MKCKQCGTEFEGRFCPECGARADAAAPETPPALKLEYPAGESYPSARKVKKKKPFFLRWWFILIVIVALVVVVSNIRNRKDDAPAPAARIAGETRAPETAAPEKTAEPEPSEPVEEDVREEPAEEEDSGELDPDFKAAMDSYEAFIDEYVAFMKKYEASDGTDLSLLADYAAYMTKYTELAEDFDNWESEDMSTAETAYYIEVQSRVAQKLLEAID